MRKRKTLVVLCTCVCSILFVACGNDNIKKTNDENKITSAKESISEEESTSIVLETTTIEETIAVVETTTVPETTAR